MIIEQGLMDPEKEGGHQLYSVPSRSDRARWITALSYKERQWQGISNKGGECGLHHSLRSKE